LSNPEIVLKNYRDRTASERKKVIQHYKDLLEKKWNRKITFSKDALNIIQAYSFPGNFREIYNTINSLFPLDVTMIQSHHLPSRFTDKEAEINESYEAALRKHCIMIYEKYNYDLAATSKALVP
jgi:transcriptional regulator of acetoin/glycerol metabolism